MSDNFPKPPEQPAQTTCQAGIDPHHYSAHSVDAGAVRWVPICTSCGYIDSDDLIAQQRESSASPANGYVVVLTRAQAEALLGSRLCNVCLGLSPSWDGHDKNPPCQGAARQAMREQLGAPTPAVGATTPLNRWPDTGEPMDQVGS